MNDLVLDPRIKTGFQVFFDFVHTLNDEDQQCFYNDNEYNYYYTLEVFARYMDRLLRAPTIIILYHIPGICACVTVPM